MNHWFVTGPVLYLVTGAIFWFSLMLLKYQGDCDPFSWIFYRDFGAKSYRDGAPPGVMLGWLVFGWPLILFFFAMVALCMLAFAFMMLTFDGIATVAAGPEKMVANWLTPKKPEVPEPEPVVEVASYRDTPEYVERD